MRLITLKESIINLDEVVYVEQTKTKFLSPSRAAKEAQEDKSYIRIGFKTGTSIFDIMTLEEFKEVLKNATTPAT